MRKRTVGPASPHRLIGMEARGAGWALADDHGPLILLELGGLVGRRHYLWAHVAAGRFQGHLENESGWPASSSTDFADDADGFGKRRVGGPGLQI